MYTVGEETEAMREASYAVMNKNNPEYTKRNRNNGKTLRKTLSDSVPGLSSGTLYSIGEYFGEKVVLGNIKAKIYGSSWNIPIHLGTFENSFKKLGFIGLGLSIYDNRSYGIGIGLIRSGIDIAGFMATVAMTASGGWAAIGIGLGIGLAVEFAKWGATSIAS